ncbi:MAG: c-type cytochrome [Steroidobacteraceae bacterium]
MQALLRFMLGSRGSSAARARKRWFVVAALLAGASAHADEAPDLSGAELYQHFCASCHGQKARGNGPVARTLKVRVPDLTRIAARNGGAYPVEQVRQIIDGSGLRDAHGTRDMPVWGWQFYAFEGEDPVRRERVAELIGRMVDYLASIQRK